MKKIKLYFISFFLLGFLTLIICEVIFQALPVSDIIPTDKSNKKNPYIRKIPKKEYFVSIGNLFQIKNYKKTNNAGYFSNIDYYKNKNNISIIGDSYVEALQVSNNKSIGGLVNNNLFNTYKINAYAFGYSASPLSQYLGFARMAKDFYDPQIYVFIIISNDFNESYQKYIKNPRFFYYDENYNLNPPKLQNSNEEKGAVKSFVFSVLKKSALVRYFTVNNYFTKKMVKSIIEKGLVKSFKNSFEENTELENIFIDKEIYDISYKCIDKFVIDLKNIVSNKEVILVFDGIRTEIYRNDSLNTDFEKYHSSMNEYLINASLKYNFNIINLHESFENHYKIHKKKFNFDIDYHWNELGHKIASDELLKKLNLILEKRN